MKRFILLSLVCFSLGAQVQWSEGFADLSHWNGDLDVFTADSGLHLTDSVANEVSLWRYSSAVDSATWRFSMSFEFMPSASNHASFHLMSSTPHFWGSFDGYFVRVGGGSQRTVALIRRTGNSNSILMETNPQFLARSPVFVSVEVHRSLAGQWNMRIDTTGTGVWINVGTVHDNTHNTSVFAGISCRYTVTRSDKMMFGPIQVSGPADADLVPPNWMRTMLYGADSARLVFDRSIDVTSAEVYLDGLPCSMRYDPENPLQLVVIFPAELTVNRIYELVVRDVYSVTGISMGEVRRSVIHRRVSPHDVVINEIMVNPTPSLGFLPEHSYIELYNASPLPVPLGGWQLQVNQSHRRLPDFDLEPGAYVVLVREEAMDAFSPHIDALGISMAQNALTNSGGSVLLYDDGNQLIDAIHYESNWHDISVAENGGWSLERIDAYVPCVGEINWRTATHFKGGTPGAQNSVAAVLDSVMHTHIHYISLPNDSILDIYFTSTVYVDDDVWTLDGVLLDSKQVFDDRLRFELPFNLKAGGAYRLDYKQGVYGCTGVPVTDTTISVVYPRFPQEGDLIINELLPAPFSDGVSFVELLNVSSDYIELNGLSLSNINGAAMMRIINESRILPPSGLLVVTPSLLETITAYPTHNRIAMHEYALPSMPNAAGTVEVWSGQGEMLDAITYHEVMHSPFLRDVRGVSLERINPRRPSDEASNWTSAAERVGWATPGVENSNVAHTSPVETFSISPDVLRPNANGFDDLLTVNYHLNEAGAVGSMYIYTASGHLIAKPYEHVLLENKGVLSWDGRTEIVTTAASGLYVVVLEVVTPSGKRLLFKDAFAMAY